METKQAIWIPHHELRWEFLSILHPRSGQGMRGVTNRIKIEKKNQPKLKNIRGDTQTPTIQGVTHTLFWNFIEEIKAETNQSNKQVKAFSTTKHSKAYSLARNASAFKPKQWANQRLKHSLQTRWHLCTCHHYKLIRFILHSLTLSHGLRSAASQHRTMYACIWWIKSFETAASVKDCN